MRLLIFTFIFGLWIQPTDAQHYSEFSSTIQKLYLYKGEELNQLWNNLVSANSIPLVAHDSAAFLFRGEAKSVAWVGDFNGWGSSHNYHNKGVRIPDTNVWILKLSLPKDARLDYKIIVNDNTYLLDPVNPFTQWSGVGGGSQNSEIRMPGWKVDSLTSHPLKGILKGQVIKDLFIDSKAMGYQLTYSLYIPVSYHPQEKLPIIYVTDGYEYMHERLGNMIAILDNLIHLKKIKPVVAVFIDHREPVNRSVNRRIHELAMNPQYRNFIIDELIPLVEAKFPVSTDRVNRAIMGTSVGGLSAAYFAFTKPEVFGLAGLQSPAFWFKPEIYGVCEKAQSTPVKTFITTGLINDAREGSRKMKSVFEKKGVTFEYREVNQGHSWGNFRDLIDDMLVYFFALNE
ncbi:MAG: alpha/beta hydrolase-fold protein [Cyclobacteriaceae bacterium]